VSINKPDRYFIQARMWNGRDWERTGTTANSKSAALGAIKLLIDNVTPYQISYTDHGAEGAEP